MKLAYNDQLLPLQDLGSMLGVRQPEVPHDGQPILVLQSQGQKVALCVDEVVGDRELVIRPLTAELRDVAAYQGVFTLARGELVLVLRADWLVGSGKRVEGPLTSTRRALVVDDSLTARALHRAMLEAGGFTVHAASSAQQAMELLRGAAYDVMVSDVAMEGMDGIALTAALRSRPETRTMPIILVSAKDNETDKERGLATGADGFLSKKDCAAGRLLAEVSSVIARRKGAT
jgi:CheY-like chemotaxis protein